MLYYTRFILIVEKPCDATFILHTDTVQKPLLQHFMQR